MISIITPTYNRPDFLRQVVDSFMVQDYKDKEMIIINDGGSEEQNIYAMLKDLSQIKYYWKDHANQAVAQNYGIAKSRGELICTLDDDDLFYDKYSLSQRVDYFKRNKDVEVIWTNGIDIHSDGNPSTEHYLSDGNQIWNKDDILINSMMWRKSIKTAIGGYFFDRNLTSNEDWDFKIRCIAECTCMAVDILTVKHRVHGEMRSNLHRQSGELSKNAEIMFKKLKEKYKC